MIGTGRAGDRTHAVTRAVDPGIFKAYDVRGLYGDQIDEELAYRIGRAFPRVLADMYDADPGDLRLAIGRDMRLTAPALAERYAMGMRDAGAHRDSTSARWAPRCSIGPWGHASWTAA